VIEVSKRERERERKRERGREWERERDRKRVEILKRGARKGSAEGSGGLAL